MFVDFLKSRFQGGLLDWHKKRLNYIWTSFIIKCKKFIKSFGEVYQKFK